MYTSYATWLTKKVSGTSRLFKNLTPASNIVDGETLRKCVRNKRKKRTFSEEVREIYKRKVCRVRVNHNESKCSLGLKLSTKSLYFHSSEIVFYSQFLNLDISTRPKQGLRKQICTRNGITNNSAWPMKCHVCQKQMRTHKVDLSNGIFEFSWTYIVFQRIPHSRRYQSMKVNIN